MKFEIQPAQLDFMMVKEINRLLEGFEDDLKDREAGTIDHAGYFDRDREIDISILKKHIEACKTLLNYYR